MLEKYISKKENNKIEDKQKNKTKKENRNFGWNITNR